ncbi:MAG: hypothetical protein ABIK53_09080 [bacterium]
MFCQDLKRLTDIKLKIISTSYDCNAFKGVNEISLAPILSHGICPFLLHLCFPYYETFHAGGSFPWVKDPDSVIVQCPYIKGAVEIEIRRRRTGNNIEVYGSIRKVKGECVWGCKEGMKVEFDLAPLKNLCFRAYNFLFPHLFSLGLIEDEDVVMQVQCPKSTDTIFELLKEK